MKKASILILSIWALLFLSLLAFFDGLAVRQEILLEEKIEGLTSLYQLAYSGTMLSIEYLSLEGWGKAEGLNSSWADSRGVFKDIKLGKGSFSLEYSYINNLGLKKEMRYGVVDEERKLNINYAQRESLKRLLVNTAGISEDEALSIAGSIIDWRDPDDILNGSKEKLSEKISYLNSGYGYTPPNRPLKSLEELLLVKNMTKQVFVKIRDFITVFSKGEVNINTVSYPVLESLGFDTGLADKIISFRCGPDLVEGTSDDRLFSSPADITKDLSLYFDLSKGETAFLQKIISSEIFSVCSENFTSICRSRLDNSRLYGKIICVFSRGGDVKYWGMGYSG